MYPDVLNGRKEVSQYEVLNSTYSIEVSAEYKCEDGYNLDDSTVSCNLNGSLDKSVGQCVKGLNCFRTLCCCP